MEDDILHIRIAQVFGRQIGIEGIIKGQRRRAFHFALQVHKRRFHMLRDQGIDQLDEVKIRLLTAIGGDHAHDFAIRDLIPGGVNDIAEINRFIRGKGHGPSLRPSRQAVSRRCFALTVLRRKADRYGVIRGVRQGQIRRNGYVALLPVMSVDHQLKGAATHDREDKRNTVGNVRPRFLDGSRHGQRAPEHAVHFVRVVFRHDQGERKGFSGLEITHLHAVTPVGKRVVPGLGAAAVPGFRIQAQRQIAGVFHGHLHHVYGCALFIVPGGGDFSGGQRQPGQTRIQMPLAPAQRKAQRAALLEGAIERRSRDGPHQKSRRRFLIGGKDAVVHLYAVLRGNRGLLFRLSVQQISLMVRNHFDRHRLIGVIADTDIGRKAAVWLIISRGLSRSVLPFIDVHPFDFIISRRTIISFEIKGDIHAQFFRFLRLHADHALPTAVAVPVIGRAVAPGNEIQDIDTLEGFLLIDAEEKTVAEGEIFSRHQRKLRQIDDQRVFAHIPVLIHGVPFKADAVDGILRIHILQRQVNPYPLARMVDPVFKGAGEHRDDIGQLGIADIHVPYGDGLLPEIALSVRRAFHRVFIAVFTPEYIPQKRFFLLQRRAFIRGADGVSHQKCRTFTRVQHRNPVFAHKIKGAESFAASGHQRAADHRIRQHGIRQIP